MQILKRRLKAFASESSTLQVKFNNFLLQYRNGGKFFIFISKTSYKDKNRFDSGRCCKFCSWKLKSKKIQSNIGNLRSENTIVKQVGSLPMQPRTTYLQPVYCTEHTSSTPAEFLDPDSSSPKSTVSVNNSKSSIPTSSIFDGAKLLKTNSSLQILRRSWQV